jgi:predicted porin
MEFFMMKKTAIALGIASMAFGAQAAEVFKNADTAIEVNVDLQFYNLGLTDVANAQQRNYLLGRGSQIQFKASKMIDANLTVFGQFESDPDPVGDDATLVTDDIKFGLKSKSWGTLQVGSFDSYMEDELAEIAGAFLVTQGPSA